MKDRPKFVVDAMLGSLARKLRIFGFDTLYFKEGDDVTLERLARKEGRVILTSDAALSQHAEALGLGSVLVRGRTDRSRLVSIANQLGSEALARRGEKVVSRCALCNGVLEQLGRSDAARAGLPPRVVARHRLFYRCSSCSKVYWRGKHWARLWRLSASLRRKNLT